MKKVIRKYFKLFIPQFLLNLLREQSQKKQIKNWETSGCPLPPPNVIKQATITNYQQKYGYNLLIETGTFLGDMVEAQKSVFKKIISIELSIELFEAARQKFKNNKNILIVQGDSGKVLPAVLENVNEPAIFWLDGHFSAEITAKGDKECPIFEELQAIFDSKKLNHVLVIDDARCFNGEGDYPTIEQLTEYVQSRNSNYQVEIKYDMIRYVIQL